MVDLVTVTEPTVFKTIILQQQITTTLLNNNNNHRHNSQAPGIVVVVALEQSCSTSHNKSLFTMDLNKIRQ